jgi:hypothetical protein
MCGNALAAGRRFGQRRPAQWSFRDAAKDLLAIAERLLQDDDAGEAGQVPF